MLPFEEQYLSDVLSSPSGGLLVLSSGLLRLQTLIPSLLSHHPSLLLLAHSQSPLLRSLVPADIPGDLPAHHRAALYKDLKPHLVTPRVLVADLLTGRCRAEDVEGVVVVGAERVSETSTEAFVVRLLRMGNKGVVVYAVTDRPQAMVSGFAKAERVMKSLLIRKLHLWPRFHVQVSADLEKDPPEVVDIRVPMTAAMKAVQNAVLEAMDACLKELRRTNKVDVEDLTVESGLFKSFDEIVRRQLDPIWHTIGKKTRQLVADLRTLRKLADYLVRYDAVTFLIYLDTLRASEGAQSIWIFANSSHKIFEFAKRRVYHVFLPDGSKSSPNGVASRGKKRKEKEDKRSTSNSGTGETNVVAGVTLEEVLEEAPKWRVLRELLKEIQEERKNSNFPTETECIADSDADSNVILIACKDERSCMQLNDCLVKGPQQVMREEWEKYLVGKAELLDLNKRKKHKKQQTKGFGVLDGEVPASIMGNARGTSINKLENDALLAVASGIQAQTMEEIVGRTDTESSSRKVASRKGKGNLKKDTGNAPGNRSSTKNVPIDESKASTSGNDSTISNPDAIIAGELHRDVQIPFLQKHSLQNSGSDSYSFKSLPGVQFYAIESHQNILDVVKPSVIVVYHADVTFTRDIEVYKAENPSKKLKVYFLFYEDSTEVQKFETSIRRENVAFESLIRQKSMMTIPVDQDGRVLGYASLAEPQSVVTDNSSTRKAGGRKVAVKEMQVIVDMREFNSSLPNVLHQKGMRIIPVTLEVGDYILSPSICVERKSISDLFQSFASGRLYNQVEMMARYYQIPVLLIEFSQDKSFSFQSANDIGDDVSPRSIVSKLSLLVLHFPRLRLVWSRSVHATAEIFASLKTNQDEPDETKAVRVGVPSDDGVVADDVRAENYNTTAVEFLRRLPGVTDSNYRSLMDGCNSLAELALLPVEKLAELMGGQKAARTLRDFLDAKCPTMV